MSAPDTNVSKQEKQHKPSLIGIKGAMLWGALMIAGLLVFNAMNAGDGEAVTNTSASGAEESTVPVDTYAPGTNTSATPTDPASTANQTDN
ncbi:hypothetical protein [Sulfitobacter sp. S190]|uniref:hypothetical protein n=1 Tax=Sulfitobacter sp. S190 TaxID=2867022 RepID=UPI0021A314F4|nr:hypothetical protein [Sulfitobacter sp. S190]UWR23647.1 hypothetical protein K3756_06675 [Sulfitobacter sp. S190]